MRLQYKAAGTMIFVGTAILLILTIFYSEQYRQVVLQKELQNIQNISQEIARHMDSHLIAYAAISNTLSSATIIRDALLISNKEFDGLSKTERKNEIETLNRQWKEAKAIHDPFIQKYLANPVAEFLKLQQIIQPGVYGEIFLTNRYGAMIASTGKLTTLAHADKYWWKSSYHEGEGRIFFDDRGFDTSVEGYVIGIVVPIKKGNEIIGILKCNINIIGPLTDVIQNYGLRHLGKLQIVRTKGLIVAEKGKIPLSNSLPDYLIQNIRTKRARTGAEFIEGKDKKELVAFSPIDITLGSEKFGFGGSHESIDHIKGNRGEAWHIVITLDEEAAIKDSTEMTRLLIITGLIFIVVMTVLAWILGKWIAKPLIKFAETTQKIGEGRLDIRFHAVTKDEIGTLGRAFNKMVENLENTLTSRDNLVQEIELRKKAEEQIKSNLKEKETLLYEIHHRVKNNMAVISSLLELQMMNVVDKKSKEALQDSQNRVQTMSMIHETLYRSDNLSAIDMKAYLSELWKTIFQSYNIHRKVSLKIEVESVLIGVKQASTLGLIVNELITNSLKCAFPNEKKGEIVLKLRSNKENKAELTVSDNGVGIPEGFNLQNADSLGLKLVKTIAENQLDGSIDMENENGTKVIIKFKIET